MYTDEDLELAVDKGIFTEASVSDFRKQLALSKNTSAVDEENFRLISGFNDIFVVIACLLLLFSSFAAFRAVDNLLSLVMFPVLSWFLAEFFVRKRNMALPAIVLLLCFVVSMFYLAVFLFSSLQEVSFAIPSAVAAMAAYLHYRRFQVPITVAAGTAAITAFLVASVLSVFPESKQWFLAIIFVCGIVTFVFAMYWDASDLNRQTRRSDVAFWLHLLSAPLIVHPVFTYLGISEGMESLGSMSIVILLYCFMTIISIATDRRAFMVSSLAYVLFAISSLLEAYGVVSYSFAVTGVCIGSALLLLSAFWHPVRKKLVLNLPIIIQNYVPKIN